jgi:hypothetical protein
MAMRNRDRRMFLAQTAQETLAALPILLHQLPDFRADESVLYTDADLPLLEPTAESQRESVHRSGSEGHDKETGTIVRVLDQDTFDAAISMIDGDSTKSLESTSRVAVLNLASEASPGGGWLSGALAQEECLCYRSSLALSLKREFYPIPENGAIYSPNVVIIRDAWSRGHEPLNTKAEDLPVVSVISVAALRSPRTKTVRTDAAGTGGPQVRRSDQSDDLSVSGYPGLKVVYANEEDRELMKTKMRVSLRIAAKHGHGKLVLGALGCGAFRNPPVEVATLWKEVLSESEFRGGWWDDVVFAVLDKGSDGSNGGMDREGNFKIFERVLAGLPV